MKKAILVLLCLTMLILAASCNMDTEQRESDTDTPDVQTTPPTSLEENTPGDQTTPDNTTPDNTTPDNTTPDHTVPCTHELGEWNVAKEASEREDGEKGLRPFTSQAFEKAWPKPSAN